jgi:hypothetical protein
MQSYIKVVLRKFYAELSKSIIEDYQDTATDDVTLTKILNYKEGPDYNYEED